MRQKSYWIKQRDNPQLGTYYVPCGQMSKKEAKSHVSVRYGHNSMIECADFAAYEAKIKELKDSGQRVQI